MEIGLVLIGAAVLLYGILLGLIVTTAAWLQILKFHGYKINRDLMIRKPMTPEEIERLLRKSY